MARRSLACALTAGALLAGCPAAPHPAGTNPAAPTPPPDLGAYRVVDLSYGYGESTLYWPSSNERFSLERLAFGETDAGYFYSANSFCTAEHGGTHMDAPVHFSRTGWTVDQVPVERLVTQAIVIDVSAEASADPDYRLTVEAVEAWEAAHGRVPSGAAVLLRTGWGRHWPDARAYLGDDTPGDASRLHFPSFGEAAARYLIEQRSAGTLGVDTASIDYGPSQDFVVHRLAGAANVPALENVARLGELPSTGAWVIALPIKIEGGSGGPVRIVALVPR